MKRNSRRTSAPDKNLHIPKKVAGGATGMALGALVAGPVGAIIGGITGTVMGSAAEKGSSMNLLSSETSRVVRKVAASARIKRDIGKTAGASNITARDRKKTAGNKAGSSAPRARAKGGNRRGPKRR